MNNVDHENDLVRMPESAAVSGNGSMSSITRTIMTGSLWIIGSLGCGHSQAEQRPAASPPSPQVQAAAVVVPASDAGTPTQPDAASALPGTARASETEPITNFMLDHFWIIVWARDAVIEGNLETLRKPLRQLADYQYDSVVPGGWMRRIGELQAAARLTSQAENLTVAASGVAAMTRVCGQCHADQNHRLDLEPAEIVTKTPKSDSVSTRMFRHSWASERLWEGLMAPSDQAWQAGAAALAHAPVRAPKPKPGLPDGFGQSLAKLRDLGLRAGQATSLDERSNLYGLTLATCAECHADVAIAGF